MRSLLLPAAMLLTACGATPVNETAAVNGAEPGPAADANQTEAMRAYAQANDRMHAGMGGAIDRDPDIAFVRGMIPHHQGAVDMAEVVLAHGRDPETRALAETVIRTQRAEIAQMEAWLEKRRLSTGAPVDHSKMGH